MSEYSERLVRVEEQITELRVKVDKLDGKIDELIALRYKGAGAFWLASVLGMSIVSAVSIVIFWLKG